MKNDKILLGATIFRGQLRVQEVRYPKVETSSFIFLGSKMYGPCKISIKEPGDSAFSPIAPNGILTKQKLTSKGIRYHDSTKTDDTWRYAKTKSLSLSTKFIDLIKIELQIQLASQCGPRKLYASSTPCCSGLMALKTSLKVIKLED